MCIKGTTSSLKHQVQEKRAIKPDWEASSSMEQAVALLSGITCMAAPLEHLICTRLLDRQKRSSGRCRETKETVGLVDKYQLEMLLDIYTRYNGIVLPH